MPCYDSQSAQENRENAVKVPMLEAMLCGMVKSFGQSKILDVVDWKQVGV